MTHATTTRTLFSALAIAFGAMLMAPATAQADPSYEKFYKQHRKNQRKAIKHHYKHHDNFRSSYYRPYYRPYYGGYRAPKVERESFHIYGTPGGGLGFSYSEYKGGDRYWY